MIAVVYPELNTSDSHYSEKTLQHASCCAYSCQCRMYFEQLSGLVHALHPSQVSTLNIFANCSRRSYSFLNSAACCSVLVSCALGGHYQRKLASNAKYDLQWKSSFVNSLLFVVVWIDMQNANQNYWQRHYGLEGLVLFPKKLPRHLQEVFWLISRSRENWLESMVRSR